MELAELPEMHNVVFDQLEEIGSRTLPSTCTFRPATSKAMVGYMRTKSTMCLHSLPMTRSLVSFRINFNFLTCMWEQFFTKPQHSFRGTLDRFENVFNELGADNMQETTTFLLLTDEEVSVFSEKAKEVLARQKVAFCLTINATTEKHFFYPDIAHTYSTPNVSPP